jgi:hypothetical protein
MDLNKLISIGRFKWNSSTLGDLIVHNLTVSRGTKLKAKYPSFLEADTREFIKSLILSVCQSDVDNSGEYKDQRITTDDVEKLNLNELIAFSELYLKNHSHLKYDQTKEVDSDNGKPYEERPDAALCDGENYSDLLKRLMHSDREYYDENVYKKLNQSAIFSDSVKSLYSETQFLNKQFEEIYIPPPIEMLPNPIHETNEKLVKLNKGISNLASMVNNMNQLAVGMSLDNAEAGEKADKQNKISIKHAITALFVSVFFSVVGTSFALLSYKSSNEATKNIEKLLTEITTNQKEAIKYQKNNHQISQKKLIEMTKVKINQSEILSKLKSLNTVKIKPSERVTKVENKTQLIIGNGED